MAGRGELSGYRDWEAVVQYISQHTFFAPRAAIFATLVAAGIIVADSAQAQLVYIGPGAYAARAYGPGFGPRIHDGSLMPFEVMRIVRSHGLMPLSRPARRQATYEVIAGTRSGGQMRVVIDAFSGDVVKVNPIAAGGPNGPRLAAPYDPSLPPPRP